MTKRYRLPDDPADAFRLWIERLPTNAYRFHFPQVPEADFDAPTIPKGRGEAADRLVEAIDARIVAKAPFPVKAAARAGELLVPLEATQRVKLHLLAAAQDAHVYPAELARRMMITPQEARRIMSLKQSTKLETLVAAFRAVGRELVISPAPLRP